jgi:hypothetical protein
VAVVVVKVVAALVVCFKAQCLSLLALLTPLLLARRVVGPVIPTAAILYLVQFPRRAVVLVTEPVVVLVVVRGISSLLQSENSLLVRALLGKAILVVWA